MRCYCTSPLDPPYIKGLWLGEVLDLSPGNYLRHPWTAADATTIHGSWIIAAPICTL